ncbi:MAG TPA: excinuclease ABC subunit UvrC [Longimicrobiaceae bacterium]|nr:excinuclease ABC subunit UvrC [Longimicrobiaceae bacterium]
MTDDLTRRKLRHLPASPGVYLMKDAAGEVIYVGKANSLRSRVRSYFTAAASESLKTREMMKRVRDLDTIVVSNEAEALILENNLIKEYKPRFNINLRDDKTYPYIKVTWGEPFPRILVTRRLLKDGARYFGPYTDVRRMRHLLDVVKKLFTVRSCQYRLPTDAPSRPCLDFHIGRCKAPCVGLQSEADYRAMIEEVVEVLSGHTARAAERLKVKMAEASAEMQFERAAELRDSLAHLDALAARQKVMDIQGADRDVIGIARDGDDACGVVMRIREGKLLGRETIFLANLEGEEDSALLGTFVTRYYTLLSADHSADLPPEILFPSEFEDRLVLQGLLRERSGRAVRTHVPLRGEKTRIVALASQNARHMLEERKLLDEQSSSRAPDALYELQEVLELSSVPRSIVCFDISHTQGTETVASAVWFENGDPNKAEYRKLKIRGEWGNDDFRSMDEAVTRYFRRRIEESKPLPDLVLIDGGKGQLSAARKALDLLGLAHQAVVSLAKRDEEVFLAGRSDSVRLSRRSPGLRLLQRARDEAHRFAVSYNRKLRGKRTIRSELGSIPGVGAARQQALLEYFGSMRALREATPEEISRLPGFGRALAEAVSEHMRSGNKQPT